MSAKESRPRQAAEAAPEKRLATQHQDTGAHPIPHLSASDIAASIPAYALLVMTPTQRVTRRLFLSLHAAVKAAERAQKRGSEAHLEMVRVVPYSVGAELHGLEAGGPR